MSWSYRVIHWKQVLRVGTTEEVYRVVEMFANPDGWGDATPQGESLSELRGTMERMTRALEHPIIEVCAQCQWVAPKHKPDCPLASTQTETT